MKKILSALLIAAALCSNVSATEQWEYKRVSHVAMGETLIGHISSTENPADLATKVIPGGQKRDHLVNMLLRFH